MDKIIECVANFSDGRSEKYSEELKTAVNSDGSAFLHLESNEQAGRSVITFAGSPEGVLNSALKLAELVFSKVDMTKQSGEHPRIGALDVCPFVPLYGASIEDCDRVANKFGQLVAEKYNLPVFLYRESARQANRQSLAEIRKGQYENFESKINLPEWNPDFGEASFNSQLGGMVTGARPVLVAWNYSLAKASLKTCKTLARKVRTSFKTVRTIGWSMETELGLNQISCNFEDFSLDSPGRVFKFISDFETAYGFKIVGSEIIGLIPSRALATDLIPGRPFRVEHEQLVESNWCSLQCGQFAPERLIEKAIQTTTLVEEITVL